MAVSVDVGFEVPLWTTITTTNVMCIWILQGQWKRDQPTPWLRRIEADMDSVKQHYTSGAQTLEE